MLNEMDFAPHLINEIYGRLSHEVRLYALGLCDRPRTDPDGEPKPGRPRELKYQQRLEVYVAWWNALNNHAVHLHDRHRDRAVDKLQAKFRALTAARACPHELARITS